MSTDRLPVARPWFRLERIDDHLSLITEPRVSGWLQANTWHLRGRDRDLLIDCGLGVASLRDFVNRHVTHRQPAVVLTHAHLDHMGSAHEYDEVWAHPAEPTAEAGRGTLRGKELMRVLDIEDTEEDPMPDLLVDAVPEAGYDVDSYVLHPVTPTRLLEDGDVIDLGDRRLDVLHLPGHTPGSIALHDRANRALFTGDIVYDAVLIDDCRGASIPDYRKTMRRLLELDVDIVHAGHAPSFDGARLHELARDYLASRA